MADMIELQEEELAGVAGGAYNPNGNPQLPQPLNYRGRFFKYWIKKDDTLSAIAVRYGVDQGMLQRINAISDVNWIYAGQYLWIPDFGK